MTQQNQNSLNEHIVTQESLTKAFKAQHNGKEPDYGDTVLDGNGPTSQLYIYYPNCYVDEAHGVLRWFKDVETHVTTLIKTFERFDAKC
jgi:hypothetical protein